MFLEILSIEETRVRRAVIGGLLIEMPSPDTANKVNRLAEKLKILFKDTDIRVSHPIRRAELRITNLDDSVSAGMGGGGCESGERQRRTLIRVGLMWSLRNLQSIWMQCPLEGALKATEAGRVQDGLRSGSSC